MWAADGALVCDAIDNQSIPRVATDMAGGIVIAWEDYRSGPPDIYAQRLDGAGNRLWPLAGVAVCTATDGQYAPELVGDGGGGAVIAWYDRRAGTANFDIFAQQVNSLGTPTCNLNGVSLCVQPGNQLLPSIVVGAAGAIVAWHDLRGSDADIYAAEFATCEVPVPVAFSRVSAREQSGAVLVEWVTSPEAGAGGFRVYRSGASVSMRLVASLPARTTFYRDGEVVPGSEYQYQIGALDAAGDEVLSPVTSTRVASPALTLDMNHPNPFNPATTISFTLPSETEVQVSIFDAAGRLVKTLQVGTMSAGHNGLQWNGTDERGQPVSSGVYFCCLRAEGRVMTQKLTLVR
jgi:hypothetical protein